MKIYIADDDEDIRGIIGSFLKNSGYLVSVFETGDALLAEFLKNPSDMVILDVMMPGTDGVTICNKIRSKSNVPIIIVSAKDSEIDRINGITMGADDYLIKPFAPMELVVRVGAIFRRMSLQSSNQSNNADELTYGDIKLNTSFKESFCNGEAFALTPTEFALLSYMFANQSRAVSREELLKNVWDSEFSNDTKVCDDVLKRLRKKLANTTVRVISVWGYGFKLKLEE
ncbi:response regulator transcription factor [Candidatus Epulonipiscium viviparus]|uniref:response regulator transcription factor n=1 Tax=Candidatus Epulonipiscium viviparus TaxID=420336 RepID=UPI0027380D5C|nr:response regulator transcription factor [Candidatus Epulopiscium viviparus]